MATAWSFRTPVLFKDAPTVKQLEKVVFWMEGSFYITPIVDNVALTALKTSFTGTASGKSYKELPLIVSSDFIQGRTVELLVEDLFTGSANVPGFLHTFDVVNQPMICGTDQLTTSAYNHTSDIFDGGDPAQQKEWTFFTAFYKGTPTIQIFNNATSIYNAALPAATTKQKYQIALRGNYGTILRWTASGAAAGGIFSVKPEFVPIMGGSMV